MNKHFLKRRKKRNTKFNPTRAYLDKSVEAFLKGGGKITQIVFDENSYKAFISEKESLSSADEFLQG